MSERSVPWVVPPELRRTAPDGAPANGARCPYARKSAPRSTRAAQPLSPAGYPGGSRPWVANSGEHEAPNRSRVGGGSGARAMSASVGPRSAGRQSEPRKRHWPAPEVSETGARYSETR